VYALQTIPHGVGMGCGGNFGLIGRPLRTEQRGVRILLLLLMAVRVAIAAPASPPMQSIDIRLGVDGAHNAPQGLPKAYRATRKVLRTFRRSESRRFVMLSDLSDNEAAAHLQLLERTAHAVEDFRRRLDLADSPEVRTRKMLAVAFGSRADFLWFANQHDNLAADWMSGYFAPEPGRLVYYHAQDLPGAKRAMRTLEQRGTSSEALASFLAQSTAAVVVHEAAHMILHEEGILPANSGVPLWLAEGVAASFEPVNASRTFGPLKRENGRTKSFEEDVRDGTVPPLEVLVSSLVLPGGGEAAVRKFYDASASFCSWLARDRPEALARVIHASRTGRVGHDRAGRVEAFEFLVGPIDAIEAAWLSASQ
jgi:hypothetical protein